jgi:ATP-dependent DNA ligase
MAGKPTFIAPMAATLVETLPAGAEWLYEAKFDGYRAIVLKDGAKVKTSPARAITSQVTIQLS